MVASSCFGPSELHMTVLTGHCKELPQKSALRKNTAFNQHWQIT